MSVSLTFFHHLFRLRPSHAQSQQEQLSFDKATFMQQLRDVMEERFKKFEEDSGMRARENTHIKMVEKHHAKISEELMILLNQTTCVV